VFREVERLDAAVIAPIFSRGFIVDGDWRYILAFRNALGGFVFSAY